MNEWIWKRVMRFDGEPVLNISLRRPELKDGSRAARRIGRYYEQLGDLWRDRWETVLFPRACEALNQARDTSRPFQPWSAALDYTVTSQDDTLLSLYLDATERIPSAHPMSVRTAVTWDLRTGTPRLFPSLLPCRAHWRKRLTEQLTQQAAVRLAGGESLLYPDVEARIGPAFSAERFYLSDGSLAVFYPMHTLGPAAEGIPVFLLDPNTFSVPDKAQKKTNKIQ